MTLKNMLSLSATMEFLVVFRSGLKSKNIRYMFFHINHFWHIVVIAKRTVQSCIVRHCRRHHGGLAFLYCFMVKTKINSGKSLPPMRIGLASLRLWHLLCLQSHASNLTMLIRLRLRLHKSFLVRLIQKSIAPAQVKLNVLQLTPTKLAQL